MEFFLALGVLQVVFWVIVFLIIIYLVFRRFEEKKKENFDKRDY